MRIMRNTAGSRQLVTLPPLLKRLPLLARPPSAGTAIIVKTTVSKVIRITGLSELPSVFFERSASKPSITKP